MLFYRAFIPVLFSSVLLFPFVAQSELHVITTTTDLAAIAQEIGEDKIEVHSLLKGNQDPHYIDPKPSMILRVNKADILINVGASLETGWLPTLIQNSRNSRVLTGSAGRIDASERIRLLDMPTTKIDRSMGDVHPEGNPHYWLDPHNALAIADMIAERFSVLDPKNAEFYAHNLAQFRQTLEEKVNSWEARMKTYRNQKIVVHHKEWEYLADWLGLEIAGHIEPKPGIPPSPKHITTLIEQMQSDQVKVILSSNLVSYKASKPIARKTGAQLVILPTSVGGEKGINTYVDLLEHIISTLYVTFEK